MGRTDLGPRRLGQGMLLPGFKDPGDGSEEWSQAPQPERRLLITFARYRLQRFLLWKAQQAGKRVLLVDQAYTTKTCRQNEEIVAGLCGRLETTGRDGTKLYRDINGVRGGILRDFRDTLVLANASVRRN